MPNSGQKGISKEQYKSSTKALLYSPDYQQSVVQVFDSLGSFSLEKYCIVYCSDEITFLLIFMGRKRKYWYSSDYPGRARLSSAPQAFLGALSAYSEHFGSESATCIGKIDR